MGYIHTENQNVWISNWNQILFLQNIQTILQTEWLMIKHQSKQKANQNCWQCEQSHLMCV